MIYKKIHFYHFRNIRDCSIDLHSKNVLLVGENAQGKTNFLEAVYLLSYGASFRTNRLDEIVAFQQKEFGLNATMTDEDRITHNVHFQYADAQKEITLNKNRIIDRKDMLYHNPTILFSYEDYKIVTEGHERKRVFFDQIQCFRSLSYVDLIRTYKRILRQRNKSLKEHDATMLHTYDYQLARAGLQIVEQRRQCVEICSRYAQEMFRDISSEEQRLEFVYSPSWKPDTVEGVVSRLEQRRGDDLRIGYSSSGPHRDRIAFYINGKDSAIYASTGQIRSVALIVKVVQSMIIFDSLNKKPMLLFDDVLLELDNKREEGVLAQLPEVAQLFFTFLPHKETKLLNLNDIQKITVKNGTLSS